MDTCEMEQYVALAANWREAEEVNDHAAAEAFEDELYARVSGSELRNLKMGGRARGNASSGVTDSVQSVLERMWDNASARLG